MKKLMIILTVAGAMLATSAANAAVVRVGVGRVRVGVRTAPVRRAYVAPRYVARPAYVAPLPVIRPAYVAPLPAARPASRDRWGRIRLPLARYVNLLLVAQFNGQVDVV